MNALDIAKEVILILDNKKSDIIKEFNWLHRKGGFTKLSLKVIELTEENEKLKAILKQNEISF